LAALRKKGTTDLRKPLEKKKADIGAQKGGKNYINSLTLLKRKRVRRPIRKKKFTEKEKVIVPL